MDFRDLAFHNAIFLYEIHEKFIMEKPIKVAQKELKESFCVLMEECNNKVFCKLGKNTYNQFLDINDSYNAKIAKMHSPRDIKALHFGIILKLKAIEKNHYC